MKISRSENKPLFGQHRIVKAVFDTDLLAKLDSYLEIIKANPDAMGQKLLRYITRIGVHIQDLDRQNLHQYLLRTKEPVIFAERHVKGNGSDWNHYELDIMGNTSFITEVTAFDNGASGSEDSALKIEQHKEPLPMQFLISVSGPIFKKGTQDYKDVVDENGNIVYAKYYKKIEKLLLPTLLAKNAICKENNLDGTLTLPGIGCGEYAGEFRGIMGIFLNAAIKDLLAKHNASLGSIQGIMLDTFDECKGEIKDFGHIKYVVAPSGLADKVSFDHHLEVEGKKLYLSQLAGPAERAEFFKAVGLEVDEDNILCGSYVAADKCSHQGNDAIAGYRDTDEGRKAAGSDIMGVHSGSEGYYDTSNEKSPRYRSYTPGDQGYGYAFIKNRDKLLPLTDETVYAANCDYTENPLAHDPQISSAFYVKLCQLHKGKDTKRSELVKQVRASGPNYEKTLTALLKAKADELKKYRLEKNVLKGQEGNDEMYNGLVDLFIDQDLRALETVTKSLTESNRDCYSGIEHFASFLLASRYPDKYEKDLKASSRRKESYSGLQNEMCGDIARAFTHDFLANYVTVSQHITAKDFMAFCFGKKNAEDFDDEYVVTKRLGTVLATSNIAFISQKLDESNVDYSIKAQILWLFMDYCRGALLSHSAGAAKIRELRSADVIDQDKLIAALDMLDGDFVILDISAQVNSYTLSMIAPDEKNPGHNKYVEMRFTNKSLGIKSPDCIVEISEYQNDDKGFAHALIAKQIMQDKDDLKPTKTTEESISSLIASIFKNAEEGNTVIAAERLDTAKNNFKQRALPALLNLYTSEDTDGLHKLYSELESGTPLQIRIMNKAEAEINKWLEKPKAYWSLCYAAKVKGPEVQPVHDYVGRSSRRDLERGRRGFDEEQPKPKTIEKVQLQIKDEMVSVDAYRRELGIRALIQDASSNAYLERINKHSANNYASWLKAMGIKSVSHINVKESEPKVRLEFKNQKSRGIFYKELGKALGIPQQNLDKENGVIIEPDHLELIKHIYRKTHKPVNQHHQMYIAPSLRIINAVITSKEKKEKVKPVIASRFEVPLFDNISDQITFLGTNIRGAINELNSTQKTKPLQFDSYIKAMDLCITSYLALNHELISAEWALKLGDLHSILSSGYGLSDQVLINIHSIKDLRAILNKSLPDGQMLAELDGERDNMVSVFNLILEYCGTLGLTNIELTGQDMLSAFGQYADLPKLSRILNAVNQKTTDVAFKQAVSQLVAEPDANPVKKHEDATTIRVQQYEKTSYQYMHVDENGDIVLMLPFTGGGIVSTDNTCKARLAIDRFCENIKGVISRYMEDLEKDIARIHDHDNTPEGLQVLAKKESRLLTLQALQKTFNTTPHLLNSNTLFKLVQNKLKFSNTISTAHLVRYPDGVRGFKCEHDKINPLTGSNNSARPYDAMFTNPEIVRTLLPRLEKITPKYEVCNYKVIFDLAIEKYKSDPRYKKAKDMGPKDGELDSFKHFAKCIQLAVQERIDFTFTLKEERTLDDDPLLSEKGLAAYREDAWMLEDNENCEFDSAFQSLLSPPEWEKLEDQIQDKAFYTNRDASTFMVMSQVFVTTLTKVYYQENGIKIDFAEFIEQPQNLNRFFDIVTNCFTQGESFVEPILDIINSQLENKGLNKINAKHAAKKFKGVFKTINGSPHYDEFLHIPNKPVEDAAASVHFYSFGGSLSCSINELELHNSIPSKPFVYKGESTDISIRNEIGNYGFKLEIDEYINPKKSPQEIAQFLTLKIPGDDEDKEEQVYNVLPLKVIQQIQNRKDFPEIRKQLVQKLGQGSYARLAKSWGMTNCLYITAELELKIYMLYATKCENEWLYDHDDTKTLEALSRKSPENRLLHMLSKLGITVVDSEILRNEDNSAYIIECEEEKAIMLLKQFVGLSNELYIRTELVESCYKAVPSYCNINSFTNEGKPNDESKIIVALRVLFPNLNIRPNIKLYNESYDPNIVLVDFCERRGYVFKCHNPETLSSIYETVNRYHADACRISISGAAMLLFIRKHLGANSVVSAENAKEAFKKANIYYIGEVNQGEDGCFAVSLDKTSQEALFNDVLTFLKEADALIQQGVLHQDIAKILHLHALNIANVTNEVAFASKFEQCKTWLNNEIKVRVKSGEHYPNIRDFSVTKLYSQKDFKYLNKSLLFIEKECASVSATINMVPSFFDGLAELTNELTLLCQSVRDREKDIKPLPNTQRYLQYAAPGSLAGFGLSAVLCYTKRLPFTHLTHSTLSNMMCLFKPTSLAIILFGGIVGAIIAKMTMEEVAGYKFTEGQNVL